MVNFTKPWPMRPFEVPLLGELELLSLQYPTWKLMFDKMGVNDISKIPEDEISAHIDIVKLKDGGDAFLKIMKSFDDSEEFRELCYKAVQNVAYPIQAVWGADDPFLTLEDKGEEIKKAAGLETVHQLSSRHFLQEEKPMEIVEKVEEIIELSNKMFNK